MPHVELPQAEFKVVMLGDTFTGKTSLVLRFAEGYYRDETRSEPTVGAFFITKRLQVNGIMCKIQIWDTAGQSQFRPMAPMYYKNAAAAIVCYDVSSPQSYKVMRYWLDELHQNISAGSIVIAIAATKSDLLVDQQGNKNNTSISSSNDMVPTLEAEEMANAMGAIFVDTSAKTNTNVTLLFRKVAERVLYFRERAKRNGVSVFGIGSIPVAPGASIDDRGLVVQQGLVLSNNNNRGSSSLGDVTNQTTTNDHTNGASTTLPTVGDTDDSSHPSSKKSKASRRDKRKKQAKNDQDADSSMIIGQQELKMTDSADAMDRKGNMCGENPMLGCGILPSRPKSGESSCVIL